MVIVKVTIGLSIRRQQQHKHKVINYVPCKLPPPFMSFAAVARNFSGVRAVEGAVKNIIAPVYDKFHLVPDELHLIADRSADHRPHAPPRITASNLARAVYTKCEPAVTVLYERYEARAEQWAAAAWRRLLPRTPKAACWAERYNDKVSAATEKGCRISAIAATKMFSEKRS
ncbi:hypothetical protein VNO78_11771 [Psophocarpus tetragonolobus]|uniref:Uncharacterized protein n=1 Tax=Psophocarpus tetragonolobus TaxID=3891 RepID=A0AAN9SMY8_PSOTE